MNITCSAKACPVLLSAACVFYEGVNLPYTGINMNDNLQVALEKIDTKFNSLIDVNIYVSNGTVTSNRTVTLNGKTLSFVGSSYTTIFQPAGTLQLGSLAGVGNRMVIADTNGLLSTQAIPLGTVTSVDMSVPTGFAISGNPVTTSGTLALAFASGYSLPTNASQSNWNTAYNWVSNFPALVAGQYLTNNGTSLSWGAIDLSGYVPYTGATQDVDLGTYGLITDFVRFNPSSSNIPSAEGVMWWDNTEGTIKLSLKGNTYNLPIGESVVARVRNSTGGNLLRTSYQAVRVTGAQGQRLAVALAQANNDPSSASTIGIVCEDISTNQEGFIVNIGQIVNINTTGNLQGETWADGNILYLSPTIPGAITNIKPVAPQHTVIVGYVEYAHANNGKIYVKIDNGYELEELHDCLPTPYVNNGVLYRDTATNLWRSATIATLLGYTPVTSARTLTINGTTYDLSANRTWSVGTVTSIATSGPITGGTITTSGTIGITQATTSTDGYLSSTDWNTFNNKYNLPALTSGSVLFSNGTTIAQNNANLFWDNTNGRLGIGTNTPAFTFHVSGPNAGLYITRTSPDESFIQLCNQSITSGGQIRGLATAVGLRFTNQLSTTEWARFHSTGNFGINTGATDGGQRLQVQGHVYIKGNDNSSSSYSLQIQNSLGTNTLLVSNDGSISSTSVNTTRLFTTGAGLTIDALYAGSNWVKIMTAIFSNNVLWLTPNASITKTSGDSSILLINQTLAPTSGTTTSSNIRLEPTINQTGGANGITRGLYVNPTLTAAADWRSIEWSNTTGWGLYGAGTANNYIASNLYIGTTTTSTAKLTVSGSSTATSALAQGVNLTNTLVAAANNDVLAALDINPTFTNGAFTGVSNWALRIQGGNISLGTSTSNPTINLAASNNASATQFVINNSAYGGTLVTFRNPADSRYFRISGINFDLYTSGNIYPTNVIAGQISFGSSYGTIIYGFNNSYLNLGGDTVVLASRDNTAASISLLAGNGDINFQQRPSGVTTLRAKFAISTGNFMIQNGGTFTDSGERLQVIGDVKVTGTMYQNSASDALYNFQNAGANKWRIGNAYVAGANYFQLYDSFNSLERIRWNNNSTATFTSDFTFVGGSNAVATFQGTQPDVKIQATGGSNAVSLTFTPSNGFEGVIQNNVTNGFIQVKTASTIRVTFKNGGQVNFQPLAADPAGAGAGDVYYNSGTNKLRLYDGTSWVDLN